MQHSAIHSSEETFLDTPTREKGQFTGDTVDISFASMAAVGDRNATKRAIREILYSATHSWKATSSGYCSTAPCSFPSIGTPGRVNAVYPNGDNMRDIPDYTEFVPGWVLRYYQESGDASVLSSSYDALKAISQYIQRSVATTGNAAGLVYNLVGGTSSYQFGIIDWPAPMRYGYDWDTAVKTVVNLWAVDAYRSNASSAKALGRPQAEVDLWTQRADDLAAAINSHLRRPDGVYVDGIRADGSVSPVASQHSSSFALAFGIVPADKVGVVGDYVASLGMKQGPMTAHRLLQGLDAAGRDDAVLDRLTDAQADGWANLLSRGGTFTWEEWNPQDSESYSHGWGAQSAVDVTETMLGVRVVAPGASRLEVVVPETALTRASGSVMTQRGRVTINWQRLPQGVHLQVAIPVNTTAVVSLPVSAGARYVAAGGGGNARPLGVEDGRARFEMGSGTVTFQPVPAR
jgi:alpha-L-rhamnosidase